MRDDFCAMILSHGRPNKVITEQSMRRAGYTGRMYIVVDDEDETADEYLSRYGDMVLRFSKSEVARTFDIGDPIKTRGSVVYARNASFELARSVGCKYFMQLDDDYGNWMIRWNKRREYVNHSMRSGLDDLLEAMIEWYEKIPALSIALSQGGEHIGGGGDGKKKIKVLRKAMNTFLCSVDRPFKFFGRMNDDVNTVVNTGSRGGLFLTILQAMIVQNETQQSSGGLTEMYLQMGTYVKSFYSVMYNPSSVKVGVLTDPKHGNDNSRIHHRIDWIRTVPMIVREKLRKTRSMHE